MFSVRIPSIEETIIRTHGMCTLRLYFHLLSVVKAGYNRKCMFLRPTLHPSIFLVVGCNGAILVSQVPMMTLLVVYTDE